MEVLREMDTRGISPCVIHFRGTIETCTRPGQWEKAVELLREMQDRGIHPSTLITIYSYLISLCGKARNWQMALSLFQEMKDRGIEPDMITYSAAISACDARQWD